jgi:4-amino-4-deoxychorismate lyase
MYPYIETIKILDGAARNLSFHQSRFERTRSEVLGFKSHPSLEQLIAIPDFASEGLFKCRILYDRKETHVEFHPYTKPVIRSLKLVTNDRISYAYKSADRSSLSALYNQKDPCDDILIVKQGYLTDSYYANVVFWDGKQWLTPDKPLLKGCMRAYLLENKIIIKAAVRVEDLSRFTSLKLINALNDWNDAPRIPVEALSW